MAEKDFGTEENVLISAGPCTLSIRPRLGAKVASILFQGHELLQTPLHPYALRNRTMGFNESDASGWDECLPSVGGCTVETAAGVATIPDHGDVWREEWQTVARTENSVTLRGQGFSLPLALERKLTLTETAKGCRIDAAYTVTNTGTAETVWSWSAHPGYAAETGDILQLPDSIKALRIEWTRNNRLDKSEGTAAWPLAKLTAGGETDLRISAPTHSGVGDKLFAGPLAASENWVALERPKIGARLRISFDAAATPYLGLWICQDGYPEGGGLQQHCVAMEPCTAPVDSLAVTGPWSRILEPGESFSWPMVVEIESIKGVN
jgi:galactose mutarotase-like enzyme